MDGVYVGKSIGLLFDLPGWNRWRYCGPAGDPTAKIPAGGLLPHTRKPSGELGGTATLTGGNYDRLDAKGFVEFPIADTLAGSLSYLYKNRDPYIDNHLGDDGWSEDNQAAQAACAGWHRMQLPSIIPLLAEKDEQPLMSQIVSATGSAGGYGLGETCLPRMYAEGYASNVYVYGDSHNKLDSYAHTLNMNFELQDRGSFQDMAIKSISGYRNVDNDLLNNSTGASSAYVYTNDKFNYDAWSQELQFTGSLANGFADFVLGAFYFNEDGDYSNNQEINAFYSHIRGCYEYRQYHLGTYFPR